MEPSYRNKARDWKSQANDDYSSRADYMSTETSAVSPSSTSPNTEHEFENSHGLSASRTETEAWSPTPIPYFENMALDDLPRETAALQKKHETAASPAYRGGPSSLVSSPTQMEEMDSEDEEELFVIEHLNKKISTEIQTGQYDKAEKHLNRTLEQYKELTSRKFDYTTKIVDVHLQIARCKELTHRWEDALASLTSASEYRTTQQQRQDVQKSRSRIQVAGDLEKAAEARNMPPPSRRKTDDSMEAHNMSLTSGHQTDDSVEAPFGKIKSLSAPGDQFLIQARARQASLESRMREQGGRDSHALNSPTWPAIASAERHSRLPIDSILAHDKRTPAHDKLTYTPLTNKELRDFRTGDKDLITRLEGMAKYGSLSEVERIYAELCSRKAVYQELRKADEKPADGPLFVFKQEFGLGTSRSLLQFAAVSGNIPVVENLLLNGPTSEGKEAPHLDLIYHAAGGNDMAIVEFLLDNGSEAEWQSPFSGRTPLHIAATYGRDEMARLLLSYGVDINAKDIDDWTPLYTAAIYKHASTMQVLLENEAQVDVIANDTGGTALHAAASHGRDLIVRVLIEHGAGIDDRNTQGDTPLYLAVVEDREDMVRLLLTNGANPHAQNFRGLTPYEVAGKTGIKRLLEFYDKQSNNGKSRGKPGAKSNSVTKSSSGTKSRSGPRGNGGTGNHDDKKRLSFFGMRRGT